MNILTLLRPHIRDRYPQLCLLQVMVLLKTLLGGTGFMLVIPALDSLDMPLESEDPRLVFLISLIPGTNSLSGILLLFLVLMIGMAAISYYAAVLQETLEQGVVTELRKEIYRLTLGASWQFVGGIHRADYARIQADEIEAVSSLLGYLLQLTTLLVSIIVYTLLCFYLSASVTLMAAGLAMLVLTVTYPIQQLVVESGARHLSASEQLYRQTNEQITGIRAIKASTAVSRHQEKFGRAVDDLKNEEVRYTMLSSLTQLINSAIAAIAFCLLAWLTTQWLETDTAILVVIALIFARMMPQIGNLQSLLQRLAFLLPSLNEVTDYMTKVEAHQELNNNQLPVPRESFSRGIVLQDLSFRYPGSEQDVLSNLTTEMPANSITLITGSSGIGKSTLADIVAGLSIPTRGQVMAGEIRLSEQCSLGWRQQVTYLPQTPYLIDASLRDNLCLLTNAQPDDRKLMNVLKQASASFVLSLPDGLNTIAGEDGNRFSAGEKQRLLLARALLEETPVLILDESTSNLDAQAEAEFLEVLHALKRNRLIIMISHKPYLKDFADHVIVINQDEH